MGCERSGRLSSAFAASCHSSGTTGTCEPSGRTTLRYLGEHEEAADEYVRDALLAGHVVHGPAIVREPMATTFVPAGHSATVGRFGELVIEQAES